MKRPENIDREPVACEWCLDTGWVDDYDRPSDDDTPKPCDHCDPKESVAFKTVKVRALLHPRWWQIRWRFIRWRIERAEAKRREEIGPEGRAIEDELNAAVESYFLFGHSAPSEPEGSS